MISCVPPLCGRCPAGLVSAFLWKIRTAVLSSAVADQVVKEQEQMSASRRSSARREVAHNFKVFLNPGARRVWRAPEWQLLLQLTHNTDAPSSSN